ncbi:LysR family transcriptional regulator [Asaia bogorensis]|uniref:LysR family transcriptional regulator n=1 Tax=Asaia bogorensis TaxID=91915 RepID=UPI0013C46910|nr:LysR family transcriptional regulator [Asaia bogorensis]
MRKKINFNGMVYFIAVVEAGSISGAARALGVSKSVISKAIIELEAFLQTDLLIRTSKQILSTRAGEVFYRRCNSGVEAIETAFLDTQNHGSIPQGKLHILANAAYGRYVVLPVVHAFAARYPSCQISFALGDDVSEAKMTWFDVAIRTRPFDDPSLHVRRIGGYERRLVAGRCFLDQFGPVESFDQLTRLPFIGYVDDPGRDGWRLSAGGEPRSLGSSPYLSLGPINLILESLMAGQGYSVLPDFLYDHPSVASQLVKILPEWSAQSGDILAYAYPTKQRSAAVRLFIDWMSCAAHGLPFPD